MSDEDEEEPDENDGGEHASHRGRSDAANGEERVARYGVNVLVDNGDRQGAPVVFEYNPTPHSSSVLTTEPPSARS